MARDDLRLAFLMGPFEEVCERAGAGGHVETQAVGIDVFETPELYDCFQSGSDHPLNARREYVMVLYRPVGLEELLLVFASGMKAFPRRHPEQPIFYPVMNEGYAAQIAREWNTKSSSVAGYVTRFAVNDIYAKSLPLRTVGAREHQELWVPAEKLEELNAHLEGQIEVIAAFFGGDFKGMIPQRFALKGKDAIAQLVSLNGIHSYSLMDFHGEIAANRNAIFVHFPFWKRRSFVEEGVSDAQRETLLNATRKAWADVSPRLPLPDF